MTNYDITFNFVSIDALGLDEGTIKYLNDKDVKYNVYNSINDVISKTDIIYMTRIQKERLNGEELDTQFVSKNLYLTQEILTRAKQNVVIMHPLPRNDEIDTSIDNDPRAAYFRQMENGLYVRMALIQLLI